MKRVLDRLLVICYKISMKLKTILQKQGIKPYHLAKNLDIPVSSLHYHLEHGRGLQAKYVIKIMQQFPGKISIEELFFDKPKRAKVSK
jgi:predicted transcriptional regulator